RLVGMRVNQIYDIDNKTYLFRLHGGGAAEKVTLLLESGTRFHTTEFEWPKNVAPSGFSMKLRKHLKNKRLERVNQVGADRIVDFQFGTGDAAYHVLLELYDRGNVILTDYEQTILYILRPHTEADSIRFAVREKYPIDRAKQAEDQFSEDSLRKKVEAANAGESLRRILLPVLDCGPAVIEHVLVKHGLENHVVKLSNDPEKAEADVPKAQNSKKKNKSKASQKSNADVKSFDMEADFPALLEACKEASEITELGRKGPSKGYIIQVKEEKPTETEKTEYFFRNVEFHPYLLSQNKDQPFTEYATFMKAVDEFYSTQESQKIDMKTLQQEREALKKLSNVKKDHSKRLEELTQVQDIDKRKAELITCNQELVDKALLAIQSAIASQLSWPDIQELVKEAQANGDIVASSIKQLKLEINHISLLLTDPYKGSNDSASDSDDNNDSTIVDVDLALSAWANACRYYDLKRSAAKKEQKTIDASQKALKSAERKTQQTLKEVRTISNIAKARKVFWFEKFYWFVSSENYLVIGGRDAQQNELIVKRYMRPKDIYVHADIQGASSVIIRNSTGGDIPPKTLLEAGTMAISYSVAWDAKVVTNSYWVHSDQVSKTAPTGEYLGTGSFMIRGKKNFLPSCHLIMGLSLLFKLEDSFVERHIGERKIRSTEEDIEADKVEQEKITLTEIDDLSDSSDRGVESAANSFPDTEVKIEHDTGRITLKTDNQKIATIDEQTETVNVVNEDNEEIAIIEAGPSRKKTQISKKRRDAKGRSEKAEVEKPQANQTESEGAPSNRIKRGQKAKLKKMKSKYKDQDEEERKIRMMILSSSGKEKPTNNNSKEDEKSTTTKKEHVVDRTGESIPKNQIEIDENDDVPIGVDADLLDTLTGQPLEDDELLFAIPVVAPYQALQQYKFKVKLTPGTGKRGKTAKLALNMFSKDRSCNNREKDLLKSIKEEALARNIPGKVKLSAPHLQKLRK
ncbi:hypothetical protein KR222_003680, partial [Zaprionus bogoriensis]